MVLEALHAMARRRESTHSELATMGTRHAGRDVIAS